MTKETIHDLAVAYAQAKLLKEQAESGYNRDFTNEEIHSFLKSYQFASEQISEKEQPYDIGTLI